MPRLVSLVVCLIGWLVNALIFKFFVVFFFFFFRPNSIVVRLNDKSILDDQSTKKTIWNRNLLYLLKVMRRKREFESTIFPNRRRESTWSDVIVSAGWIGQSCALNTSQVILGNGQHLGLFDEKKSYYNLFRELYFWLRHIRAMVSISLLLTPPVHCLLSSYSPTTHLLNTSSSQKLIQVDWEIWDRNKNKKR